MMLTKLQIIHAIREAWQELHCAHELNGAVYDLASALLACDSVTLVANLTRDVLSVLEVTV